MLGNQTTLAVGDIVRATETTTEVWATFLLINNCLMINSAIFNKSCRISSSIH